MTTLGIFQVYLAGLSISYYNRGIERNHHHTTQRQTNTMQTLILTPSDRKAIDRQHDTDNGMAGNTLFELLLDCTSEEGWDAGGNLTLSIDNGTIQAIYSGEQYTDTPFEGYSRKLRCKLSLLLDDAASSEAVDTTGGYAYDPSDTPDESELDHAYRG